MTLIEGVLLNNKNYPNLSETTFGTFQILESDSISGKHPNIDFFLNLWTEKGGPSQKIRRSDINPVEMKEYLEHIILMDIEGSKDDRRLIIRLIGSHVAEFYGEVTGLDVRALKNQQAVSRVYHVSAQVQDTKKPVMTISPTHAPGDLYMETLALYLPLFNDHGDVIKILVCANIGSFSRTGIITA